MADYAQDAVLITADGSLKVIRKIRSLFEKINSRRRKHPLLALSAANLNRPDC